MRTPIQHGEIMLVPIDKIPDGERQKVKSQIVGLGTTGHHHVVTSSDEFEVVGNVNKDLYLLLSKPAQLVQQKSFDYHQPLGVSEGAWKVHRKSEYDPWEEVIKSVQD